MSRCLMKMPHSCGTSDGLQVFAKDKGGIDGYCFSCGTYIPDPLGAGATEKDIPDDKRLGKSSEEVQQAIIDISNYPVTDLPSRKIRKTVLEQYGVKVSVSEKDGKTPYATYFPYTKDGELVGYKCRILDPKKMWTIGTTKEVDFFGWEQAIKSGARRLIITEGEFDAIAAYRILELRTKDEFKDNRPAIVSLINGSSSAKNDVSRLMPKIKKYFKEVSICFDNDAAGEKAKNEVCKLFPEITVITLPCKDANQCLMDGAETTKAAFAAMTFRAVKANNIRLLKGSQLKEAARTPPVMGLSWPWEKLTKLTRGIRRGETYYFGAGVKMGKSELVNSIADHIIRVHNLPVFLCKPEEPTSKTYQMLVGKAAGKIFHDPDRDFDFEAFDAAEPLIGDKAIIVDSYQFVGWDSLKADIIYACNNDSVKDVIIDPITCLTVGKSAAETNEFLVNMAAELSSMSKDHDFTAYLFCHLKAPDSGPPHERGGEVLSTQFTGSRAMMRSCNMMVGLEGNKDPNLPEIERNMRRLKILEDRNLGVSGYVDMYWDNKTGLFNEVG